MKKEHRIQLNEIIEELLSRDLNEWILISKKYENPKNIFLEANKKSTNRGKRRKARKLARNNRYLTTSYYKKTKKFMELFY